MLIILNKKLFFIFIIISISFFGFAQEQSSYFTFGYNRMDRGKLIDASNPQSIIIAGETEDTVSGNKLLFLSSLTEQGNMNWYKNYGSSISYAVNDWSTTNNGGFILSAEQYYLNDRETLYLVNLDGQGNILWTKLFDEGGNEVEGLSINQTQDGGFIVTGLIKFRSKVSDVFYAMKQDKQYMYILKTDNKGNKEWSKKFNYDDAILATGSKVIENKAGYLIGGVIGVAAEEKGEEKSSDMALLQLNRKGDFLWAKSIGGSKSEYIKNMLLIDNDVFIIGATTSFGEGKSDAFLMRMSDKGVINYFKTYGGIDHESMNSIIKVNENTLLLAGATKSYGNGSYDAMILTLTTNGEIINAETFGQEKHDEMGSAVVSDDKVFMTGFSFASKTPKSTQAYMLSYKLNMPHKQCFFKEAKINAKNYSSGIKIKELNKQMLSDIPPVEQKSVVPVYNLVVKNKICTVEQFCK